jgi:PfaB family protein
LIPPTINVSEPISSSKGAIASDKVVKSATPWFEQASLQRGAVSAFGFGGTNSHLILERESQDNSRASGNTKGTRDLAREKMAIVGMDSFFGSCNSLTAFERCIYEGHQSFIPVSGDRWQGIEAQGQILKDYGFTNAQAPLGGYIKDFAMDYLHCKIPPNPDDQPIPQQLLILKVADQAIRDAGLEQGANVAAIVAMETELTCHKVRTAYDLEWQVEASLAQSNIALPPEKICELKNIVSDSIIKPMQVNQCLSFIGNIMASRISALWNLSGPSFTLSAQENSTFKALEVAQMLLAENQVDAVVVGAVDLTGGVENVLLRQQMASINTGKSTLSYDRHVNGWTVGEGAGAVVLKRLDRAKQNQDRIYAAIDAISLVQENSTSEPAESLPQPPQAQAVTQACQQAFQAAGIKPEDIGYLEVFGSGVSQEDEAEVEGLLQAYQTNQPELSCAIGSVKANIGHTYAASGMASLIKTALCLYHEYLPATPQWSGAKQPEAWQGSPFYVAPESRNWFLPAAVTKRVAAINGLGLDRAYAHLILSEEPSQKIRSSQYLAETPFYLFPLAADDRSALLEQLGNLQQTLEDSTSLVTIANQIFADFQKHSQAKYALAIVGHNREELNREIQRALKGVAQTFDRGEDWKTPLGSYFTARPLSKQGGVAFVYPGSFTSYIGIGQDIYHLFPKTLDSLASFTSSQSVKQLMYSACQLVYPRSLERLSKRQLEALEVKLLDDPIAMLMSGIVTAQGLTTILQDYFQVKPKAAFGYSLGEVSMMFAHNVWTNIDEVASKVNSSSLFRNRISGSKNAVRDYWGLDTIQKPTSEDFWSTYVLINPAAVVKECLKNEDRVYLTQINTPDEVVIAGDTQSCLKVIKQLGCNYFPAPSSNVIHCEAIQSEFDEFVKWFTLPCQSVPEIDFYSAADYTRTTLSSQTIAHSIAKALCNPLDFPRLINQIYEDGARIFIEVGPGNTCCRWIRETLKHKDQIAIPLNSRGLDDHKSIVRALAQLLSNRVSVDLSCLYGQSEVTMPQKKSLVKTVTVGGCQLKSTILSAENQKKFVPQSIPVPAHNASIEQSALPKVEKSKLTVATSSVLPNKKKAIADNHHQRISTKKL